jgi:uncharacterized membrane protein YbhN (UPF0104 family)
VNRVLATILRAGVALVLFYLALRAALPSDQRSLAQALLDAFAASPAVVLGWAAAAAVCFGLSTAISAWRFRMLLRAGGLVVGFAVLVRSYLVAGFFNQVLPGVVLGDVYRIWDTRQATGRGSDVVGFIALERLLGLSALGTIGALAAPALPLDSEQRFLVPLIVGLFASFVIVTFAALYGPTNRWIRAALRPVGLVSERAAASVDRSLAAVAGLSAFPGAIAGAFALSIVAQLLPVLAVLCVAQPLDGEAAWYWYAVIVPAVTFICLIPITLGGAGLREYLYVAFFGAVGMRSEVALALSLSIFAVTLLWGAVGLLVFVVGRKSGEAARHEPEQAEPADGG